jgi:hypothetical protein
MSKNTFPAFLLISFLALTSSASGAYLVDTGAMVQGGYGGTPIFASNPPTDPFQSRLSVAGQFTLQQPSKIADVEGWMANDRDGFITAAIYQDRDGLPGQRIHAASFEVRRLSWELGGVAAGWFGPDGLEWTVGPGTYWLAFEVLPSDSMFGVIPNMGGVTMQGTAPMPLGRYALQEDNGWNIGPDPLQFANYGYGMRLAGEILTSPVPLPAAMLHLGSALGLFAIASFRRRRVRLTNAV